MSKTFGIVVRAPLGLRYWACVLALGVAGGPAAAQQASAPDADSTPPQPAIRELVAAVNSGERATMERFVSTRVAHSALERQPAPAYVELLAALFQQGGGVTLGRTERLGDGIVVTLMARNADRGVLVYLSPDRADPARLGALEVLTSVHPAATLRLPTRASGEAQLKRAIATEAQRLAAAGELSGVVAVERRGRVVYERAFGAADAARGIANAVDTRFHLASLGKMFTAVAVAQLVAARRLTLDDSVASLLPELPWSPEARGVTVRQLLAHTSGLGQADSVREGALARLAATRPAFNPGTRFSYSNDGYEVLGAIIERVSGESYAAYVRRHILRPARMTHTEAGPADVPVRGRAIGYRFADDDYFGAGPRRSNAELVRGHPGNAAGGQYASADDLLRFARALHRGTLLPLALLDTLVQPRWPLPGVIPDERYGYGFTSYPAGSGRAFGHGGGGMGWGICSSIATAVDGSYTVAVLTNLDPPLCEKLGYGIVQLLAASGETSAEPPR